MSLINDLKKTILAQLSTVTNVQDVADYEKSTFSGYPAITLTCSGNENEFNSTGTNLRTFLFDIRCYEQIEKVPQGLRLTSLAAESSDFTLRGTGSWLAEDGATRTRLALDGGTFVLAVTTGQLVSHAVTVVSDGPGAAWAGSIGMVLPVAIFALTTFAPPHADVFRDQMTGGYGLAAGEHPGPGQAH